MEYLSPTPKPDDMKRTVKVQLKRELLYFFSNIFQTKYVIEIKIRWCQLKRAEYFSLNRGLKKKTIAAATIGRSRMRNLTYKSVQLPSEPPLMDASIQLKELGEWPHREDALKKPLELQCQNNNFT